MHDPKEICFEGRSAIYTKSADNDIRFNVNSGSVSVRLVGGLVIEHEAN